MQQTMVTELGKECTDCIVGTYTLHGWSTIAFDLPPCFGIHDQMGHRQKNAAW